MKRWVFFWGLLLISAVSLAQHQDQAILVNGQVLDAETHKPLSAAHLVVNGKSGAIPDADGTFKLQLLPGDTLLVSHVGYMDHLVPIPQELKQQNYFLRIALPPATIELEAITVYQWPATVEQFKQELLSMEVKQEKKVVIPGSYQGPPKPVDAHIGSPVSFLYEKLSRRARQRRAFQKKRREFETQQKARTRWDPAFVKEITGIEDEQTVLTFMEFCQFPDEVLGSLNDYDLIVAINQCYEDFKEQL